MFMYDWAEYFSFTALYVIVRFCEWSKSSKDCRLRNCVDIEELQ